MNDDWRWMLGVDVSVATFCLGALVTAFRSLSASMRKGDDALHSRINQVRDEYVRRHDMDIQMNQLRESVRELREELRTGLRETNKRLDQIIAVMAREKT